MQSRLVGISWSLRACPELVEGVPSDMTYCPCRCGASDGTDLRRDSGSLDSSYSSTRAWVIPSRCPVSLAGVMLLAKLCLLGDETLM